MSNEIFKTKIVIQKEWNELDILTENEVSELKNVVEALMSKVDNDKTRFTWLLARETLHYYSTILDAIKVIISNCVQEDEEQWFLQQEEEWFLQYA